MKRNSQKQPNPKRPTPDPAATQPFIEHVYELRRRLFYIALSVFGFSIVAYVLQQSIIGWLIRPSHGQQFIYTSPIGGVDFLFRVCLYAALIVSIPVIIYNALRYIQPLIAESSARFIAYGSIASGLLALAGLGFGYFVGLPAALHFLLHQFVAPEIRAMITIQSYLQFVMVYMLGSALLFQVPLVLLLINRIKPLKPRRLLHYERWVILVSFVMSGLMNPTPRLLDQLLVAGPLILMYQVGIGLVALVNRKQSRAVQRSFAADIAKTETPLAQPLGVPAAPIASPARPPARKRSLDFTPLAAPHNLQTPARQPVTLQPLSQSRKYIDGFVRPAS